MSVFLDSGRLIASLIREHRKVLSERINRVRQDRHTHTDILNKKRIFIHIKHTLCFDAYPNPTLHVDAVQIRVRIGLKKIPIHMRTYPKFYIC
jgi:hypothetical protein